MGCASGKLAEVKGGAEPGNDGLELVSGPSMRRADSSWIFQAQEIGLVANNKSSAAGTSKSGRSNTPCDSPLVCFDKSRIGTHTRHGVMPGPRGVVAAKINQDRGVICWPFNGSFNEALLCVFDGHGSKGERIADHCMLQIPSRLEAEREALRNTPVQHLRRTIIDFDRDLLTGDLASIAHTGGTTSIICYLRGTRLWSACSGDSRAVLGSNGKGGWVAKDLSVDCKPDHPEERERIIRAGGIVSPATMGRPSRVWANGRIGLAMSRSLGDGECKRFGVIADPQIQEFELAPTEGDEGEGDRALIVASDGVWEFIESQEAVELVSGFDEADQASAALVQEAARRWKINEGNYRDDITAVVIFLPLLHPEWDQDPNKASLLSPLVNGVPSPIISTGKGVPDESPRAQLLINEGVPGLSPITTGDDSPVIPRARHLSDPIVVASDAADTHHDAPSADAEEKVPLSDEDLEARKTAFTRRRLSMDRPFADGDWKSLMKQEPADGPLQPGTLE